MCAIFGVLDYKGQLEPAQRLRMVKVLGTAAEIRGTDATGIAFFQRDRLCIQKAPKPAHKMRYRIPGEVRYIMGHTRMTTQGSASRNQNNHPFAGKAGTSQFALAHNGVLTNDWELRRSNNLPETDIETDSYVAVQLIEQQQEVSPGSLRRMAEAVRGHFTFTVLDQDNNLYFVRGENPLTIYHYPGLGLYLYASTKEILEMALETLKIAETPEVIQPCPGDILRIDSRGQRDCSSFDFIDPYQDYFPDFSCCQPRRYSDYIQALRTVALFHGFEEEYIDVLLDEGYTVDDLEDMIYCGRRVL